MPGPPGKPQVTDSTATAPASPQAAAITRLFDAFVDAANESAARGTTPGDARGTKSGASSAKTTDGNQAPGQARDAQLRARISETLGPSVQLTATQLSDIATVLTIKKQDGTNRQDVIDAQARAKQLEVVRSELNLPQLNPREALIVALAHDRLKSPSYREAMTAVVVNTVFGFKDEAKAAKFAQDNHITDKDIEACRTLVNSKRITSDNVRQLLSMDSPARSDLIDFVVNKRDSLDKAKPCYSDKQVQALLSTDSETIRQIMANNQRLEALRLLKPDAVSAENVKNLAKNTIDTRKTVQFLKSLDAAAQSELLALSPEQAKHRLGFERILQLNSEEHPRALLNLYTAKDETMRNINSAITARQIDPRSLVKLLNGVDSPGTLAVYADAIKNGVVDANAIDRLFGSETKPEVRKSVENLLKSGAFDRECMDRFSQGKIRIPALIACADAVQREQIHPEVVRGIMKTSVPTQGLFESTILPKELSPDRVLDQIAMKSLIDPTLTTDSVKTLYQSRLNDAISNHQLTAICEEPVGVRESYVRGLADGNLDARSTSTLLWSKASADTVDRFCHVVEDCRKAGVSLDQVANVVRRLPDLPGKDVAYKSELALLLELQGKDATSPQDVQRTQTQLNQIERLQATLKQRLPLEQGLSCLELQHRFPTVEINRDTIDRLKKIERDVAVSNLPEMTPYERTAVAAILEYQRQPVDAATVARAREIEAQASRLRRTHPTIDFKESVRMCDLKCAFDQVTAGGRDPLKLSQPLDPEKVREELELYCMRKYYEAESGKKSGRTDKERQAYRDLENVWQPLANSLQGKDSQRAKALTDLLAGEPHLAWQKTAASSPEKIRQLNNDQFLETLKSASKERLKELPRDTREELTSTLVEESARRFSSIPSECRQDFIKAWLDQSANLPQSLTTARRLHQFDLLKALEPGDLTKLENKDLQRLVSSVSKEPLKNMSPEAQTKMFMSLLQETARPERSKIQWDSFDSLVSRMPPTVVDRLSPTELGWLTDKLKERTRAFNGAENLKPAEVYVESIARKMAGDPVDKQTMDKLLEKLGGTERALAIELLRERAAHLSEAGVAKQLRDLATELHSRDGFIGQSSFRGRPTEHVTVVCFPGSTQALSLGYQFRKHTNIDVDFKVIRSVDDLKALGDKKVVLLDSLSHAPNAAVSAAVLGMDSVHKPASVMSFNDGINVNHIAAAATTHPAIGQDQVKQMVQKALADGRKPEKYTDLKPAGTPLTQHEFELLHQDITAAGNHYLDRVQAKSFMYFLNKTNKSPQESSMIFDASMEYNSPTKIMEQAWVLHEQITSAAPDPQKIYYIIDDKPDSNHLASDDYRTANGMGSHEFDGRFISLEQAKALATQKGITFVKLNDGIYSGEQMMTDMVNLKREISASGGEPKLICASLIGCKDGVSAAEQVAKKLGMQLICAEQVDNAYDTAERRIREAQANRPEGTPEYKVDAADIREVLGEPGRTLESRTHVENVAIPDVTSSIFFGHMRSNSTAANLDGLADFCGTPRAHNENRFVDLEAQALAEARSNSGLIGYRSAARNLLSGAKVEALAAYNRTMQDVYTPFANDVAHAGDIQYLLQEGLDRFLSQQPDFAAAMDLDGKNVVVRAVGESGPIKPGSVVIEIDPTLLTKENFAQARAKVLQTLLERPVKELAQEFNGGERATFEQASRSVVSDKLFEMQHPLQKLDPISGIHRKLTAVSDSLVIGSDPKSEEAIKALKDKHGVGVVLDLHKEPDPHEEAWCKANGLEYKHISMSTSSVTAADIENVVKYINEQQGSGKKLFVHCEHARDRSPGIVAAVRMTQGLSYEAALAEMKSVFGHSRTVETKGTQGLRDALKEFGQRLPGTNDSSTQTTDQARGKPTSTNADRETVKLIPKGILESVPELTDHITAALPRMRQADKPAVAAAILQQAVSEFLTANELTQPGHERLHFQVGTTGAIEYFRLTSGASAPQAVAIDEHGKFVDAKTKQEVSPQDVHTRVTISEAELRAKDGHAAVITRVLTGVVATSVANENAGRIDRAALAHIVDSKATAQPARADAKPEQAAGLYFSSDQADSGIGKKVHTIEITSQGVLVDGKARESVFDQLRTKWSEEIVRARGELEAARKQKDLSDPQRKDLDRREQELVKEEQLLERLAHPDRAGYDKALAEAHEFLRQGMEESMKEGKRPEGGRLNDRISRARSIFVWLGMMAQRLL